jgi:hypothetical protein
MPSPVAVSEIAETLRQKLTARTAKVGVVGLGYVGLPLAVELARAGFSTVGIDVDQRKVDALMRGESYIQDVATADVAEFRRTGRLSATADPAVIRTLDTVNICVPTPLRKTKDPDLSYVVSAVETPLGDFFCTFPGLNTFDSLPVGVSGANELDLWCHWWMPFDTEASITVRNFSPQRVDLKGEIFSVPNEWNDDSLYFKSDTIDLFSGTNYFQKFTTCRIIIWVVNKQNFDLESLNTCNGPGIITKYFDEEILRLNKEAAKQYIELHSHFLKQNYFDLEDPKSSARLVEPDGRSDAETAARGFRGTTGSSALLPLGSTAAEAPVDRRRPTEC